jgi:hypothetical protein
MAIVSGCGVRRPPKPGRDGAPGTPNDTADAVLFDQTLHAAICPGFVFLINDRAVRPKSPQV